MYFGSDNTGPVLPQVMQALNDANTGYTGSYGADPIMDRVRDKVREIFEAPEAAVYLVATGTAANVLALSCYCPPTHTIFCAPKAHIHVDECNGPEFYTNGAKLTLVGDQDKITPDTLRTAVEGEGNRGVHGPQRGPLSITQATEMGQIYTLSEIAALTEVTKSFGIPVHMDGARFANALVALNASPADMTWRAGVDVLSFGGTKNGCMGVEAVVMFNPDKAWEFELRRKRGAHLFSKHRYLSAQMDAYLTDDLWLTTARQANANMARLADGLRKIDSVSFRFDPQVNMAFVDMPRAVLQRLAAQGAVFHADTPDLSSGAAEDQITTRLVSDWSMSEDNIDRFLTIAAG
ncbi:threonine aldolase family protein [Pseudooceanicola sp. MF1-13]|uniref:threonine aldolase family protein n=1 Tax=Pseudooceanicola sp. MF1-13 TaxID=3379095 RepID=UPI003891C8D8